MTQHAIIKESPELASHRWEELRLLQQHYKQFVPFLADVMAELGFSTTEIQEDIGNYLAYGPQYLMVQAQRSQAKTTIAAAFAVWCLIHNPRFRVLIVSAGGTQAVEISTLIVRIIMTMDVLECMRPDKRAGDRSSVEAFDVHHSLKGLDKSPSVACVGIEANLQGKRADLLIPDDVESSKNGATAAQRAKLLHLTKDFTSICQKGRILWLGTPQTNESVYNSLASRGVDIRIWPGRYPTAKQRAFYGNKLAPLLANRLDNDPSLGLGGGLLGDQGQPIDPVLLDEEALQKKERDQGTPYFQLQHMLNTELSDALRFPLKPSLLTLLELAGTRAPMVVTRGMGPAHLSDHYIADHSFKVALPHETSPETGELSNITAYVDPAAGGANADETAYAIGGELNSTIYLLEVGGIPGGYGAPILEELATRLAKWKPKRVVIEKNLGYGAFSVVFTPILRRHLAAVGVEDDLVSGMKERRIIETLGPVMGRGSLVITPNVLEQDNLDVQRYSVSQRQSYSLFYQLAKMQQIKGALIHDDRADALEGLVRQFQDVLAADEKKKLAAEREREYQRSIKDPLGYNRYKKGPDRLGNNMRRWRR